jgi:hypothetical protein
MILMPNKALVLASAQQRFGGAGGGGAHAWNSATAVDPTDLSFTASDATVERTNFNSFASLIHAVGSFTNGSNRVNVDIYSGANLAIGLSDGTETGQLGNSIHSVAIFNSGGVWHDGYNYNTDTGFTSADYMEIEINSGTHIVKFKKNGTYMTTGGIDATIDVTGHLTTVYPAVFMSGFGSVGCKLTIV